MIKEAKGEAHISLARALAAVSSVSGGKVTAAITEVKVVRKDADGNVIGEHAEKWPQPTKA
jgi:hypothetical protein